MSKIISLNANWMVCQVENVNNQISSDFSGKWIEATVPGVIQYDLLNKKLIKNPYSSYENAKNVAWVAETNWLYKKKFSLSFLNDDQSSYELEFRGIDTFSNIWVNNNFIGKTENSYRTYKFSIPQDILKEGQNELLVLVKAHDSMINDKMRNEAKQMNLSGPLTGLLGKSLIRRYQRSFFTTSSLLNIGTSILGIGINNEVNLIKYEDAKIKDLSIISELQDSNKKAIINVNIELDLAMSNFDSSSLSIEAYIDYTKGENKIMFSPLSYNIENKNIIFEINNPELWWPKGYGNPNLYNLNIKLIKNQKVLDEKVVKFGIRSIQIAQTDEKLKPIFQIVINNIPIFGNGYNLLPSDYLLGHSTKKQTDILFKLVEDSGANILRFWGGGTIEDDYVYDLCDELGILVWQDCFLHSNTYPEYDNSFVDNFKFEVEGLIKRIRNHSSLLLVCGGNEQYEGWEEWGWKESMDKFYGENLVTKLIPNIINQLSPNIPYIVNSPHGYPRAQTPVSGDMHNWGNFFNSTKDPQFVTETCWSIESYSRPETLKEIMDLDVDSLDKPGWFEIWTKKTKLPKINRLHFSSYFDVNSLRGYLHSLEIEQAMADYHALYMLKTRSSSNKGIIYWSLNKGGPLFQFGCVDYLCKPLMSYYITKKIFKNLVVHVYRDIDDINVVVSKENMYDFVGSLKIRHMNVNGNIINQWIKEIKIFKNGINRVFDLENYYNCIINRLTEFIFIELISNDQVISDDVLFFTPIAEVAVEECSFKINALKNKNMWYLEINSSKFCKMVEISCDENVVFGDNFFALCPNDLKTIKMVPLDDRLPTKLSIRSLDGGDSMEIDL